MSEDQIQGMTMSMSGFMYPLYKIVCIPKITEVPGKRLVWATDVNIKIAQ